MSVRIRPRSENVKTPDLSDSHPSPTRVVLAALGPNACPGAAAASLYGVRGSRTGW